MASVPKRLLPCTSGCSRCSCWDSETFLCFQLLLGSIQRGRGGEDPVSSRIPLGVGLGPCGRPPPIPSPHDAPRRSPQPVTLGWRPLPRPLPSFWCRDRFPWLPSSGPTGEAGFAVHVHGRSSVLVRGVLDTAVLEEGDVIRASWTCVTPSLRPRLGLLPQSKEATPDSSWPPPATGDRGPSDCMVVTASPCGAAASLVDGEVSYSIIVENENNPR